MGATFIEIPTVAKERAGGRTKAFTLRNICSVAHTLLEIAIRRFARVMYPQLSRNIHYGQRIVKSKAIAAK